MLMLVVIVLTGCQTMTGRTAGAYVDDNTTTTAVKSKLVADRAANLTSVGVTTVNGVVHLTGVVETADQRLRAEQLAWQARGVQQIVNNLQVQPRPVVIAPSGIAASPATVSTGTEQLLLQLPADVIMGLRPGDPITVDVTVRPVR
jgi:hypothetical protein